MGEKLQIKPWTNRGIRSTALHLWPLWNMLWWHAIVSEWPFASVWMSGLTSVTRGPVYLIRNLWKWFFFFFHRNRMALRISASPSVRRITLTYGIPHTSQTCRKGGIGERISSDLWDFYRIWTVTCFFFFNRINNTNNDRKMTPV